MSKEHEISSLRHNNTNLEAEVEKLEGHVTKHKGELDRVGEAGSQNEALQRRLQLLEEEAEESDKNLRETNEKYVAAMITIYCGFWGVFFRLTLVPQATSDRRQSWTLRAQGAGVGKFARTMGAEVRGDGAEVCDRQEGARGFPD